MGDDTDFVKPELSSMELLRFWQAGKEFGLTQRKLAKLLGMKFNSLHSAIERAKIKIKQGDGSVSAEIDGNMAILSAKGRVKSVEQLLDACDYDPDKFVIERALLNKWEAYAKAKKMELKWEDGAIVEGWVHDTGELTIEPLWQVKAWLKNKYPEAVNPIISPVNVNVGLRVATKSRKRKEISTFGRTLVIPDLHMGFTWEGRELIPYHDRGIMSIILTLLEEEDFDNIIILGDMLDFAELSDHFVRSPDMVRTTQPAIFEAGWFLAQIRLRQPNAVIVYLDGNHENRLPKAMLTHSAWAYDLKTCDIPSDYPLLSVPTLLGLGSLGIEHIGGYPDATFWINDYIRAIHGSIARAKAGQTATAILADSTVTTVFGHVHRAESATRTDYHRMDELTVGAYCPGCACRIDGVVPGVKKQQNWQQGIGIIEYQDAWHDFTRIPFLNGKGFYRGRNIEPFDYLDDLRGHFPDFF